MYLCDIYKLFESFFYSRCNVQTLLLMNYILISKIIPAINRLGWPPSLSITLNYLETIGSTFIIVASFAKVDTITKKKGYTNYLLVSTNFI